MTRETKIGLLVGLAFIIVIGILLSDHMTSTNDLPQARLDKSADVIRGGIATPAPTDPPVTIVSNNPPAAPAPAGPMLTRREVTGMQQTPLAALPTTRDAGGETVEVAGPEVARSPIVIRDAGDANAPKKWDWTHAMGEEIVTAESSPAARPAPSGPTATEYTAEAGDSLSRLASKLMGANTKANREAIIKANPSLVANPDRIIVGRTYLIPHAAAQPAPTATADSAPASKKATEPRLSAGQSWYTVKENDNLWKIAADQLGSGNAWTQVRDLNRDILKDGQALHPNMQLRLPAKPVASAQ